jgi:hypothetical protein
MTHLRDMTKGQRKRLRELAALAYQRELGHELGELEQTFARWRAGETDAFEVEAAIHRFHQGPSRKLFTRYQADAVWAVAQAIVRGVLAEGEVGAEMVETLRGHLTFLREQEEVTDEPTS